jgi:hypothetical protein
MKCAECDYEAPVSSFRYLYNARIDASVVLRQCPNCQAWIAVDELLGFVKQKIGPGEALWGKSARIEDLAEKPRAARRKLIHGGLWNKDPGASNRIICPGFPS